MKLRKKDFKVPINFLVPPWAFLVSSSGNENFQRWKRLFPKEGSKVSSLGNLVFQARKLFGNLRNSLIFATFVVDIGTKPSFIIRTL